MVRTSTTHSSSDADLITRIAIAFTTRPRIAWNDIQVSAHDGTVGLRGQVATPYDRHLVVAIARRVAGVRLIDDKLNVAEIRGQETESAQDIAPARQVANHATAESNRQHLSQIPLVNESLEDLLATRATDASKD